MMIYNEGLKKVRGVVVFFVVSNYIMMFFYQINIKKKKL
jgi:hypothetical protein